MDQEQKTKIENFVAIFSALNTEKLVYQHRTFIPLFAILHQLNKRKCLHSFIADNVQFKTNLIAMIDRAQEAIHRNDIQDNQTFHIMIEQDKTELKESETDYGDTFLQFPQLLKDEFLVEIGDGFNIEDEQQLQSPFRVGFALIAVTVLRSIVSSIKFQRSHRTTTTTTTTNQNHIITTTTTNTNSIQLNNNILTVTATTQQNTANTQQETTSTTTIDLNTLLDGLEAFISLVQRKTQNHN